MHGLKITSGLLMYKPNQNKWIGGDDHSSSVSKQCKVIKVQARVWSSFFFFIGSSCTDCILDMLNLGEPKRYQHETENTA